MLPKAWARSTRANTRAPLANTACFPFNGNKIITTPGGGMLVSSDEERIAKVRFWADASQGQGTTLRTQRTWLQLQDE
ncbi:DegT/DnrJ/EryC1/StrS family aminotransferase [Acetomicrobium sp.]|uniref:DegT/DnrJ/EryC1/StrS family aminotransferase n=1 Tax=Acetomicrobium sp. TaxID=1872099 RepID=UPI002871F7A9|nr:DegT/DnrJ/EryC1/StrS family aminotransferase [Acetomicrobium sp.]MDR9770453.1 DegT/DnrJ/EryC1/StrS family aminotransferase [Acetomicrobium sp.]